MKPFQSLDRSSDRAQRESRRSRSRRSQRIASCEPLETRALLSAYTISGYNLNVAISVTEGDFPTENITENGVPSASFLDNGTYSGISIVTTSGTNTITVTDTFADIPVSISLSGGTGTVNTGGLQGLGKVSVTGGNSADVLNINDSEASSVETYAITSSAVGITTAGSGTVTYSQMGSVNLTGGSASDTYNIASTPSGTAVAVTGGNGNNTFNVSPTALTLGTIQGNLSVAAGSGSNTLNINDQNNSASSTYSLASSSAASSTVTRTGGPTITYASEGAVNLNGGSGNDTYNVNSTPSGTAVAISAGSGKNTFNVSPTAQTLGTIQGNLTVYGSGSNTLSIFDQNNSASDTYTLASSSATSSTVTRTGAPTIGYASEGAVNLYGGSGNDTYNVDGTPSGTALAITGGSGNDTFNVSPTAETLGAIQGSLTVAGGGGSNTLDINDQNNSASDTYTLASTSAAASSVARTGGPTIDYSSEGAVNLYGGSGNDTYNVNGTPAGTGFSITGGNGTNAFNVSPSARTLGTIQGNLTVLGGGSNTLSIFDQNNPASGTYSLVSTSATLSSVTRTGAAPISYASEGAVNLYGGSGKDTYVVSGTRAGTAVAITGGSGANTLVGPSTASTWSITARNGGLLNSVEFSGIANLTGGTGPDAFVFGPGGSVTGRINGGGGGWLDYAATTAAVTVNLSTGKATAVGGGIANIQNVRGGQGVNKLTGNSQGNILIGGASNTITGGPGRSILIAGTGKAKVTGKSGGDILIGGTTSYDSSSLANDMALESILAEWQSGAPYATRISTIKSGVGPGSADTLDWGSTVQNNGVANTLTGGGGKKGLNWFFAGAPTKTNKTAKEQVN